jgi:transcription elongation GreA/GreB family factor
MNKQQMVTEIIQQLKSDLEGSIEAANNAHLAATDKQSIAETQYDTLAIEASYLAEGQSRRVEETKLAIQAFQQLKVTAFTEHDAIDVGALVQLHKNECQLLWFFIAPASGGLRCTLINQGTSQNIIVITPHSPIGKALIGKYLDDDVVVEIGNTNNTDYISALY